MNRNLLIASSLLALGIGACSPTPEEAASGAKPAIAMASADSCQGQANSRLALFDKPDTYPISENEKRNAYLALYNECMKSYEPQIASPKPNFQVASVAPADFANLSPAAGGNVPARPVRGGVITYPIGTTVIDTAQLANLSPASGGMPGVTSATSANGSTVVVVQAPTASGAYPVPAPAPAVTQAAIPVARTAAAPVAPAAAPKKLTAKYESGALATVENTPPTPQKAAYKAPPVKKASALSNPDDKRSRFEKNAVPVALDLKTPPAASLSALSPSAGVVLDHAVTTNRLPAKD